MTDSIAHQQFPVPLQYRKADRDQIRARLIFALSTLNKPGARLASAALSDPTVAALDAWATVADVVDFYQERIATENYLTTATEPFSVLALAQLLGYRPRPGLAATCWLAYTLTDDAADTAVLITPHQQVQSVPKAGEQPQIFETTEDLVARPSWNTLPVKNTQPLHVTFHLNNAERPDAHPRHEVADPPAVIVVGGTITGLAANDFVLIHVSKKRRFPLQVATVTPDPVAKSTVLTFAGYLPPAVAAEPVDSSTLLARLTDTLAVRPSVPPAHASDVTRDVDHVLSNRSLESALLTIANPTLTHSLYPALSSTVVGVAEVDALEALHVTTAPFGVQVPPRVHIDVRGHEQLSQEWPIDSAMSIRVVLVNQNPVRLHIDGPAGSGFVSIREWSPDPTEVAGLNIELVNTDPWQIDFTPIDDPIDDQPPLLETVSLNLDAGVMTVTATRKPRVGDPAAVTVSLLEADAAAESLAALAAPAAAGKGLFMTAERILPARAGALALALVRDPDENPVHLIDVSNALPLANRKLLDLRETCGGILAGSYLMVDKPRDPSDTPKAGEYVGPDVAEDVEAPAFRRVVKVLSANPVTVNRYGISVQTTRLELDQEWIGDGARLLSDARPITIRAQSDPLELMPVPLTDPVCGDTIQVGGLHPGIACGRRLILTGERADVGTATVKAGEAIMVADVDVSDDAGATPYTTLTLATPLSYPYRRDTVILYGNVVPAHHGATLTETLFPTGNPTNPTATLGWPNVLADPSRSQTGFVSTLNLAIDGRTWTPVRRLDARTPPRSYLINTDAEGKTAITLGQPLPHAASKVIATYRVGDGATGNLRPGQLSQLMSRPLGVAGVSNPLAATGGANPDGPESIRADVPHGLGALGRVVSVQDAVDLALTWAGIGKAAAVLDNNTLTVTVAATEPIALDPSGTLLDDLGAALTAAGDVIVPIQVAAAAISPMGILAEVGHDPDIDWDTVERAVRAELLDAYSYGHRAIDQDIIVSDLLAVIHRAEGVRSAHIRCIVPDARSPETMYAPPPPRLAVTGIAYLDPNVPDTLILREASR